MKYFSQIVTITLLLRGALLPAMENVYEKLKNSLDTIASEKGINEKEESYEFIKNSTVRFCMSLVDLSSPIYEYIENNILEQIDDTILSQSQQAIKYKLLIEFAAACGEAEKFKAFINKNKSGKDFALNYRNNTGLTILQNQIEFAHAAIMFQDEKYYNGYVECLKFLFELGADPTSKTPRGQSIIAHAFGMFLGAQNVVSLPVKWKKNRAILDVLLNAACRQYFMIHPTQQKEFIQKILHNKDIAFHGKYLRCHCCYDPCNCFPYKDVDEVLRQELEAALKKFTNILNTILVCLKIKQNKGLIHKLPKPIIKIIINIVLNNYSLQSKN